MKAEPMNEADAYQAFTLTTAIYPGAGEGTSEAINYCFLGLTSEVGEIAGKFKKHLRRGGELKELAFDPDIQAEIGDAAYYLARLSAELGLSFWDILEANRIKLTSRKERGVIEGDGDNR